MRYNQTIETKYPKKSKGALRSCSNSVRHMRGANSKKRIMAIYHLSAKAISRSTGRSATAAAAYRSGEKICDERTGLIHDYTKKGGVKSADIVLPDNAPVWAKDRAQLWNAAELAEKRKDACVAKEYEVALPEELPPEERKQLALDFAKWLAHNEGCAVDVAIHEPSKNGDNRNHHAHILKTTRKIDHDGMGEKLDSEKAGRNRKADLETIREKWAALTNQRLKQNGIDATVDHRTLEAQGINREPTQHLGVAVTEIQRRGAESEVMSRIDDEQQQRAQKIAEIEHKGKALDELIATEQATLESLLTQKQAQQPEKVVVSQEQGTERRGNADNSNPSVFDQVSAWFAERQTANQLNNETEIKVIEQKRQERPITPAELEKIAWREWTKAVTDQRNQWRKTENQRLLAEVETVRKQAWALKAEEPSRFGGLWITKKHETWKANIQQKLDQYHALKQQAQDVLDGKSLKEQEQIRQIGDKAFEVFKEKHPELAQVLIGKAAQEQAEREEKQQAEREQQARWEQERQKQELTRRLNKDQDLER